MSTQQIHRITPDNPPQFPCWVFDPSSDKGRGMWFRIFSGKLRSTDTHWHTDQADAPTEGPGDESSYFGAYAGVGQIVRENATTADTPLTDADLDSELRWFYWGYANCGARTHKLVCSLDNRRAALERENARLREDKERMAKAAEEVLQSYIIGKKVEAGHPCPENMVVCRELRAAIDAARKEAQP